MSSLLLDNTPPVKPSSVIPYFDVVRLWLPTPVGPRTRKQLKRRGVEIIDDEFSPWGRYCQRLDFKQPSDDLLRWIARRSDGIVNYAEPALDFAFMTDDDRRASRRYLYRHLVRRWHRRSQGIFFCDHFGDKASPDDDDDTLTRYDASPKARNRITAYSQYCSRITGELHCFRIEWRVSGLEATRAAGLSDPRRVLDFDHHGFWQRRMRLVAVEPGRLGRLLNNRDQATRRHDITEADRKRGRRKLCSFNCMQDLLDDLGASRIGHVLTLLDATPYLPVTLYCYHPTELKITPPEVPADITLPAISTPIIADTLDRPGLKGSTASLKGPPLPIPAVTISRPLSRMRVRPRPLTHPSA
jgi:hypothetical protein